MNKQSKNILDAGITSREFSALFADDIQPGEYLAEYPRQAWRYKHLADLAAMRNNEKLEAYFRAKSRQPRAVDWCE